MQMRFRFFLRYLIFFFIVAFVPKMNYIWKEKNILKMRNSVIILFLLPVFSGCMLMAKKKMPKLQKDIYSGMELVWADEFDREETPDETRWNYEFGFVRNEEYQWYTNKNAFCRNGLLVIEGRREKVLNPEYELNVRNWRRNREYAEYTSSSINTRGKFHFQYGILEVKARIDTSVGLWPAIWTLGISREWPSCGEIDIMESYPSDGVQTILANTAWGTNRRWVAKWDTGKIPLSHFLAKDLLWPEKFHIWRMVWDEHYIRLYLDDELLNETDLENTYNPDGFNPFRQPHYILLNLAIGGQNGGDPSNTKFPTQYEVDYVRVYQKK